MVVGIPAPGAHSIIDDEETIFYARNLVYREVRDWKSRPMILATFFQDGPNASGLKPGLPFFLA